MGSMKTPQVLTFDLRILQSSQATLVRLRSDSGTRYPRVILQESENSRLPALGRETQKQLKGQTDRRALQRPCGY